MEKNVTSVVISQAKPLEGSAPAKPEADAESASGNSGGGGQLPLAAPSLGPLRRRTAILIGVSCLPLLLAFLWNLWARPAYRFYPLALVGGLWLMRRGWRTLRDDLTPGSGVVVLGWLGASIVTLLVATLLWTPWGGAVGSLLALVGMIWWVGGWPLFRALLPGFVVLMAVVPPPLGMDTGLLEALGTKLVKAASRLLYELSVPHYLSGRAVELPGLRLALADVSALVNVLGSVMAFSLFYTLWRRRSVLRVVLTLLAAPAFTVLLVSAGVVAGIRLSLADHFDVFAGLRGAAIEAGILVVGAGLVISFDEVLTFLFAPLLLSRPRPNEQILREVSGPKLFLVGVGSQRAAAVGLIFALVGVGQLILGGLFYLRLQESQQPLRSRLTPQASFSLPAQVGAWKQVDTMPIYLPALPVNATQLKVWYFELPEQAATVTLEYPLRGFENPVSQYRDADWIVWRQTPHGGSGADVPSGLEAEMQRNWIQVGALWVGALDETGRWLPLPGTKPVLFERFKPRVSDPVTARIQVLSCGREPLTADDRTKVAEFFQTVGRDLSAQIKSQLQTP